MKTKIWLALISIYIIWGSTYLAIRFAVQTMPPFIMVGTRFLFAGAILFGVRRLRGDKLPGRAEWITAGIVGLFLLVGGNGLVVWSEQYVPSGVTALIVASAPLWMALIDAVRPGGRRPNWKTGVGLVMGFIGILVLIGTEELSNHPGQGLLVGLGVLFLATFFWAVGSLYSRTARLPASPLLGTGMEMLVGGSVLIGIATLTGEWSQLDLSAIALRSWLGWLYLIIFGALVGFSAYTWLLRSAPTPLVSTYAYVNPMIALFLGSFLAQEPLSPRLVLGAVIIVGSVILINTSRVPAPRPEVIEELVPGVGDD
jgi:drug/metabolite transporter (DMT)-like permease